MVHIAVFAVFTPLTVKSAKRVADPDVGECTPLILRFT
jgi:hypothetical protein